MHIYVRTKCVNVLKKKFNEYRYNIFFGKYVLYILVLQFIYESDS